MTKNSVKAFVAGLLINSRGRTISRKIVLIESDDWGAIRTPNTAVRKASHQFGTEIEKSRYKVDSLASEADLESLFNVLLSFRDADGNSPAFTANAIMTNPDFAKIKASAFQDYHYELFYDTFQRYPKHSRCLETWEKGIEENIFIPQFHGREHLNIKRWLSALRSEDDKVHHAFHNEFTYSGKGDYSFMGGFDWDDAQDVLYHKEILEDGLDIFKNTFGYSPASFIAMNYIWDSQLEEILARKGVKIIQGLKHQLQPTRDSGKYEKIRHHFGERNQYGTVYNIRNCVFEPTVSPDLDWTDKVMARMSAAFMLGKPAVISTHRVNYVGFIDVKNRDNGLKHLSMLLKRILQKWPDVIFTTTDQLLKHMK